MTGGLADRRQRARNHRRGPFPLWEVLSVVRCKAHCVGDFEWFRRTLAGGLGGESVLNSRSVLDGTCLRVILLS